MQAKLLLSYTVTHLPHICLLKLSYLVCNAFPQRVKDSIELIHYIQYISLQKSQMEEEMYQQ